MPSPSESLMDERHEVLPGVYKRLGDCTARDLEGSLEVLEERVEQSAAIVGLLDRLAADARARGVSIIPVPAWLEDASEDIDLPTLRSQRRLLEEWVEAPLL